MEADQKFQNPGLTQTTLAVQEPCPGEGGLVSRSQAKQLLEHAEKFQRVFFDFRDVESIGPAFADEIFRVFALQHLEIELVPVNTSLEVEKMITKARHDLDTFLESD